MTDATDRIAKALFARREKVQPKWVERLWSAIDEAERTQYRLDAVAAQNAMAEACEP